MTSKMDSVWRILGTGSSSSPSVAEFLRLSNANVQRVSTLTSHECSTEEHLNPSQCRSMSAKLVRTLENIAGLLYVLGIESSSATSNTSTLPPVVLENFYLVSERAKELVESCCSEDWCQASTFQIQNEEAFKEILLETSLCYSSIIELVKDKVPYQDLRRSSTFEPPTSAEVMQDRMALLQRVQNSVNAADTANSLIQKQHLAKYLLRRLHSITSQSNIGDFDVCHLSLWADGKSPGEEWGKDFAFLGDNVCKATWLGVPCAKKVFNDGVPREAILAEARILACLNHPNIVKFICCGRDGEDTWRHFIAMEHIGIDLRSVIKKQVRHKEGLPFPLLSSLDIMLQIAYGTCYLHDNNVAHRDLKTCNVVVRRITTPHLKEYLQVKLIDFGLSKVNLLASRSNTISHPKTGTTPYMAPEVFTPGRADWFKADVYSFGIMCAVILSGEEPFSEIERCKIYEALCNGERPMLPQETPEELARLIRKCWDTDRKIRPNFVEICTELAELRHKLLRGDAHGHGLKDDRDGFASSYIQDMIKKQSEARKQDCSHSRSQLLENEIEHDEWFVPEQDFDIQEQHEEPNRDSSCSSNSSSSSDISQQLRNSESVDNEGRSSMPSLEGAYSMPSIVALPIYPGMQEGETVKPMDPGRVQSGDLSGLTKQIVWLLNQYGGPLRLVMLHATYNEHYGRPLHLAEYEVSKLADLIEKMKDAIVIKGTGRSKTLHLVTKEGVKQNNYKPSLDNKEKTIFEEKFHENLPRAQNGSGTSTPPPAPLPSWRNRMLGRRSKVCGHGATHLSHFGDCPPCTVPVAKERAGFHVLLRGIPRGSRDIIPCNQLCGKTRQCNLHACERTCHLPPCDSVDVGSSSQKQTGLSCGQQCGAPRRHCSHTCAASCHPTSQCPQEIACEVMVTISCSCGRLTAEVSCDAGGFVSRGANDIASMILSRLPAPLQPVEGRDRDRIPLGQRKLQCDDECAKLEWKRLLADIFGATVQGDAVPGLEGGVIGSGLLAETIRQYPQWAAAIEDRFKYLVQGPKGGTGPGGSIRLHVFGAMIKERREVIYQMAERWGLAVAGHGYEARRFVIVHITSKSKVPVRSLLPKTPSVGVSGPARAPPFNAQVDMEPGLVVGLLDLPREPYVGTSLIRFVGECELVWLNDDNALAIFADGAGAATALRTVDYASVYRGATTLPGEASSTRGGGWGIQTSLPTGSQTAAFWKGREDLDMVDADWYD